MTRLVAAGLLLLSLPLGASQSDADRWWAHVVHLADDRMRGRETGSPEHRAAAEYVAEAFRKAGLQPGAGDSYLQPVSLVSRRIDEAHSSLTLLRDGREEVVTLGAEAILSGRVQQAPRVEAPLVFAGYGLTVPEAAYDDLAGLEVKGKIVVYLAGMPPGLSPTLYAHYNSNRWQRLRQAGALGTIAVQNPKVQDVPWARQAQNRSIPQMALVDASLDATTGQQVAATINPAHAEKWFAGSGHTFADILDRSNAGTALPRFPLHGMLRSVVAMIGEPVSSENVVGILPGSDPVLKSQFVVLSAHLDHLGVGEPIGGDSVFNGAMDNAAGIATLIEAAVDTAAAVAARGPFKRTLVFLAVTAEEKGLLGSRYFATQPTVPAEGLVANLNTDMFLPLFPLKSIVAQGLEESDLAADLRAVAAAAGVEVLTDPEPERNAFTRSDQYSFIRQGVPALSLKVGYTRDSPEHEILKRWRNERYHAVTDDLLQPVDKQAAVAFNRIYAKLLEAVANRPSRPRWNADSFFKRFAAESGVP